MNTKMLKTLLILTLLSLALTACAGASADLEGTSWQLVDFAGKPPVDDSHPTIAFEDGRVNGNASCNSYSGEYSVKGDSIAFGMMMSTMMACVDNALMEQEQDYLAFLGDVERYELHDGQLLLTNAAGDMLVFEPQD